jgi:CO/xanthine dehydrogenase FAD-binding subunit
MVPFAAGTLPDTRFLNLWGLAELRGIEVSDRTILLGALTTYTELRRHAQLGEVFPNLIRSAAVTGALAIQNRGTLGGNLVNGSPAGDTPPSLLAYDADVELCSVRGSRWISYAAFHTGYKRTALQPGELLTRILLRKPQGPGFHYFRKVGTRAAQAIAKVSLALHAQVQDGTLSTFRVALGAVAPVPLRAARVEALLRGEPLKGLPVRGALAALQEDIAPIDDVRSTARYRRQVAAHLLEDALTQLLAETRV